MITKNKEPNFLEKIWLNLKIGLVILKFFDIVVDIFKND